MPITFENIIYDKIVDALHKLLADEFNVPIYLDEHKGNQSFLIKPVSDELIGHLNSGIERQYNIEIDYQLKIGGYIRYINLNNKLKWGGILLKVFKQEDRNLMVIGNSSFKRLIVSFDKNYVFYKSHKTASDINRKVFISFLEKYKFED